MTRVGTVWRPDLAAQTFDHRTDWLRGLLIDHREAELERVASWSSCAAMPCDVHDVLTGRLIGRMQDGELVAVPGIAPVPGLERPARTAVEAGDIVASVRWSSRGTT